MRLVHKIKEKNKWLENWIQEMEVKPDSQCADYWSQEVQYQPESIDTPPMVEHSTPVDVPSNIAVNT